MHRGKRFRNGRRKESRGPYFKHDFLEDPWITMLETRISQGLASDQEWQLFAPTHPFSFFVPNGCLENPWRKLEAKHGIVQGQSQSMQEEERREEDF